MIGTSKTQTEVFPENSMERDPENRPPRYWRNKDEDLRDTFNHKRTKQEVSL